jgi:alpha-beta hydrolase superfamily lysophospholipase
MKQFTFVFSVHDGANLFARVAEPATEARGIVVAIHGLGVHSAQFSFMEAAMTSSGYVVASFDMRGHGRSVGQRGDIVSFEHLFGDIDSFLCEIQNRYPGPPLFLYGFSLGGTVALSYGLTRHGDIAGVVAVSPWLRLVNLSISQKLTAIGARALDAVLIDFVTTVARKKYSSTHDEDVIYRQHKDPLVHAYISNRSFNEITRQAASALTNAAVWRQDVPLAIFHGDEDAVTDKEASRLFVERAGGTHQYIPLEGFYHSPHIETSDRREKFFALCSEWMNAHEEAPGDADENIE